MRYLTLLILLSSCSASWHVKKAIRKDPNIFEADTITVIDTIRIEVPKVDTSFVYQFDTVEMVINDVKIKHHYDTTTNEVYIEADCPDQEVITKTETIKETIVLKPSKWEKYKNGFLMALIFVIGFSVWRFLFKR
jgi:hypothetical protein